MIVIGAFQRGSLGHLGAFTPEPIREVYSSSRALAAIRTSMVMAGAMPPVAIAIGFYFAWLATRTNTPGRKLVTPMMVLVLAAPNFFMAISWSLFGNERSGLLNEAFRSVTALDGRVSRRATEWLVLHTIEPGLHR